MNFYNEFDPSAAAWLRELIARKLIPDGVVDERSISDLQPSDLHGYTQCHFFAGIGGWSLALELAGVDPTRPLWTGSCPCQPYSAAGKGLGDADPRNLWPAFFRLIRECRPELVLGEQVADAIGKGWLDGVSADLEGEGYACGAAVLGAHSVGAPHIRKRLYWVADAKQSREWRVGLQRPRESTGPIAVGTSDQSVRDRIAGGMADSIGEGLQGHAGDERDRNEPGRLDAHTAGPAPTGGTVGGMGNPADAARERDARGLPSPEAGEHGARVAVDGGLSVGSEHAGSSMDASGMGDATGRGLGEFGNAARPWSGGHADGSGGASCGLGDAGRERDERRGRSGDMGHPAGEEQGQARQRERCGDASGDPMPNDQWLASHWLLCRDGKHRRVPAQSALFPLADGFSYKLARRGSVRPALLKGAGNAIVPQVAAEFIQSYLDTLNP